MRKAFAHGGTLAIAILPEQLDVALRIGGLDAHDLVPGAVAAAAFDEDDLHVVAKARNARDDGLHVAALVVARNHDGGR